jgi:hypothetical protein
MRFRYEILLFSYHINQRSFYGRKLFIPILYLNRKYQNNGQQRFFFINICSLIKHEY